MQMLETLPYKGLNGGDEVQAAKTTRKQYLAYTEFPGNEKENPEEEGYIVKGPREGAGAHWTENTNIYWLSTESFERIFAHNETVTAEQLSSAAPAGGEAPAATKGTDAPEMKTYSGTKIINAVPMTRVEYNIYRGWEMPSNENPSDPGYLVEYEADPQTDVNHKNHLGYISWSPAHVFEKAYNEVGEDIGELEKTLSNTIAALAKDNVKDIVFWGDGDTFKLISKASSKSEGWMKSTKAMQCGLNVVVQVTTQQRTMDGNYVIAEALTTVVGVSIHEITDGNDNVIKREIR